MSDFLLSDGKYHLTRIETIADGIVDENRVGYSNEKPDDMYLLKHGDILYSNINSISHMGKVAKYQGNSPIYHGINLLRLKPENNINSDFLLYLLNTEKCRNWAKTRANQAVSQASINQSLLTTQEIAISSFEEQKKIGDYFHNLNHLITLHQSKFFAHIFKAIDNSTLYWEQRKHGEVFIYLRNNTLSREELNDEDGFAQSIHYGDVLIRYGECLNVSKELLPYIGNKNIVNKFKKFYIQNGDVIIADTAEDETVGKCIEISGIVDHNIISGLHTIPLRPINKFAYGYLGFYLNSNSYHNQLKPLMQGIKVTSISKNLLKITTVNYPSNIQEQKIIGRYFDALNHLITLHQLEPFQLIFKAIAYRIIDYFKSKPPRSRK